MPKFNFPLTFDQFLAAVKDKKTFDVLGGDIAYAYSCLKMGWMNKHHHKEKQMRDQEIIRTVKARIKAGDKDLERKLSADETRAQVRG